MTLAVSTASPFSASAMSNARTAPRGGFRGVHRVGSRTAHDDGAPERIRGGTCSDCELERYCGDPGDLPGDVTRVLADAADEMRLARALEA